MLTPFIGHRPRIVALEVYYDYITPVMDDFSRFILGWGLKPNMSRRSLEDVVQQAIDFTGMTDVPVEDRTVPLSDNDVGYISQQFNQYLRLVGIRHVTVSPFHPQTNGKIERYHRSLKGAINQGTLRYAE